MFKKLALVLAFITATCVGAAAAGSNTRSWVSATGNDSNSCSVTQPCQTFQGAIANTASGGEINCLGPGGFGGTTGLTITISVTIDCEGASNGGIEASGGNNAITISTANITVNLIGLDIDGENGAGMAGVSIVAPATVNIRNCKIYGFEYAVYFQPTASGGTLVVDNAFVANNGYGIWQWSQSGVSDMTVRNSNINNNIQVGILVEVMGGTHAGATIEQTTLAFNGSSGLLSSGSGAVALIGSSTVVNNYGAGVLAGNGGTIYSFKNNQIGGNSTDGTPLTAYPGGPLN
jgi:hypothetical protein